MFSYFSVTVKANCLLIIIISSFTKISLLRTASLQLEMAYLANPYSPLLLQLRNWPLSFSSSPVAEYTGSHEGSPQSLSSLPASQPWLLVTPQQTLLQQDYKSGIPYSHLLQQVCVNIPLLSVMREATGKQQLLQMQNFQTFQKRLTQWKPTTFQYFILLKEMKTSPIHQSTSLPSAFTPGILRSTMNTYFLYFTTNISKQPYYNKVALGIRELLNFQTVFIRE